MSSTTPRIPSPLIGYTDHILHLRARNYFPNLGTFLSLDPFEGMMGRAMSLNGYGWVEGNTPNLIDPSGLCPGVFCDPNSLSITDEDCWYQSFLIYKETGFRIDNTINDSNGAWSTTELADVLPALNALARQIGGMGSLRHYLGSISPVLVKSESDSALGVYYNTLDSNRIFVSPSNHAGQYFSNVPGIPPVQVTIVHEIGHLMAFHDIFFSNIQYFDYLNVNNGASCDGIHMFVNGICRGTLGYKAGTETPTRNYGNTNNGEDLATAWEMYIFDNPNMRTNYPIRYQYFSSNITNTLSADGSPTRNEYTFDDWFNGYYGQECCHFTANLTCWLHKDSVKQEWANLLRNRGVGVSGVYTGQTICS
jgi:RHS repeat-associated protein